MVRFPSFAGRTASRVYALAAPALVLAQHLMTVIAYRQAGARLTADAEFWLLPLRKLALMPGLTAPVAALAFVVSLAVTWGLALLSFRRARWSGTGYALAALAIVPGVQVAAIAVLAVLPQISQEPDIDPRSGMVARHVIEGALAGVAIIVLAVLVSAVVLGSYGWGLFVMTPLMVGITTGYLANRRLMLSSGRNTVVVLASAALGTIALVMLALEGLVCILLAAPLGAMVALIGGAIGRAIARKGQSHAQPLLSVAFLPALFALEAAMPPAMPIATHQAIDISAPPSLVWQALTSSAPINSSPGLVGAAGFAYPIRGRLLGSGVGAVRLGVFSTGVATERVTEWGPGRLLSFIVLHQPPAMAEMSPYRRVNAPHLDGYFETGETRFTLVPTIGGGTRLTVDAVNMLRIDPALYWQPLARLAIGLNVSRVLQDVKQKAEAAVNSVGFVLAVDEGMPSARLSKAGNGAPLGPSGTQLPANV